MPLTKEQKKAYLEHDTLCPYCGSEDIEGGDAIFGNGQQWQNVICNSCGKKWTDEYTLTNILEEEDTQIDGLDS
jgi:transposase-like protein